MRCAPRVLAATRPMGEHFTAQVTTRQKRLAATTGLAMPRL